MLGRKMRGFVDPYTLGMVIALIGAVILGKLHSGDGQLASTALMTGEMSVVQAATTGGSIEP